MSDLSFYIWSDNIGCAGCVGKIEKAVQLVDKNSKVSIDNIATYESRITITTKIDDFKDKFNSFHKDNWILCSSLSEYANRDSKKQYQVWADFLVLVSGAILVFLIGYFQGSLSPLIGALGISISCSLICLSLLTYYGFSNDRLKKSFEGTFSFDHSSMIVLLAIFILLVTVANSCFAAIFGSALCFQHFHCPIILLAGLSSRDYFSFAASRGFIDKDGEKKSELLYSLKRKDKTQKEQKINSIQKDDVLYIQPGQLIPCDGAILGKKDDMRFDTVITDGDVGQAIAGNKVKCGWVYSTENNEALSVSVEKVKGQVQDSRYKKEFLQNMRLRQNRRSQISIKFTATFIFLSVLIPLLKYIIYPSFGLMNSINMVLSILMITCPCSILMVFPFIRNNKVNKLYETTKGKDIRVQNLESLAYLSRKNIVFCWDRTNTLTNPDSPDASELRSESISVINKLKKKGFNRHYILSGNKYDKEIGTNLNIEAKLSCSAKDKHDFILDQQQKGNTVVMIGDGENDLLALAQADVSIGMWHNKIGYGSSLPVATSDIALNNALGGIPEIVEVAQESESCLSIITYLNIFCALLAITLVAGASYPLFGFAIGLEAASFYMLGSMCITFFIAYGLTKFSNQTLSIDNTKRYDGEMLNTPCDERKNNRIHESNNHAMPLRLTNK